MIDPSSSTPNNSASEQSIINDEEITIPFVLCFDKTLFLDINTLSVSNDNCVIITVEI